jgi:zinc carboxypeptidase
MVCIGKRARFSSLSGLAVALALVAAAPAQNGRRLTTPKEALGFEVGDDYQLATYTQLTAWWKKLATDSDRMKLVEIGKTEEGRPQWMAILTSPENHKKLERYKDIAQKLAHAEGLTDDEAHALAREGKAVIWIDGGLHATEVLGAHQLMEFVWEMLSRNDAETQRFLNDVVILAVHCNPDGMELVSSWYMRQSDLSKRSTQNIPRLYQKYIGHDNNRDFYMSNMSETTNMNRQLFIEWFPQIMYNHHQTGPAGAVMFAPPFRDPFNYNFDPLIPPQIEMVGSAMHSRFILEGKPGTTMRSGASYSTWYNGGLRTSTYFHNMIGLLTETIGNPTPMEVPLVPERQLPNGDEPFPVPPQTWHFKTSIEYSMTANRAVLDYASRYREQLLFNIYRMGRNSIERGNRDSWTVTPKRIAVLQDAAAKEAQGNGLGGRGGGRAASAVAAPPSDAPAGFDGGRGAGIPAKFYASVLHDPALRDPRGFIVPSDQPDFPTATKFINTLIKNGITVHRATADFQVADKRYPAGSWVVKSAQAFRPHVLDMFEPQDHPNDLRYPGGPPIPPYDVTGYTLAFQMGVKFDRILDAFDGPFEKVNGLQKAPPEKVRGAPQPAGYLVSHQQNDSFVLINRLLKNGDDVYWLKRPTVIAGRQAGAGTIYVPARPQARTLLDRAASELGVTIEAVASRPSGDALKLKPVRIGLWDQYSGSMPSGWLRWIFEQYEFPFEVVYPAALDQGDLASHFDVLVFPSGAMPRSTDFSTARGRGGFFRQPTPEEVPEEYRKMLGRVTTEKTIPQLRKFVESGGTIVTVGDSSELAHLFGLPVTNALVERTPDGQEHPLPREKFYVPGSVLRVNIDNTNPVAYGMAPVTDVFFENNPVFRLAPDADLKGLRPVAWFPNASPLRSGWAWGQGYLAGTVAAAEAPMGEGKVFLLGVEAAFRGQPHGTYKLLFNSIYAGTAKAATLTP